MFGLAVIAGASGALTASAISAVTEDPNLTAPATTTTTATAATTTTEVDETPEEWCERWESGDHAGLYAERVDHIGINLAVGQLDMADWGFDQGLLNEAEALRMHTEAQQEIDAQCEQVLR